MRAGGEARYLLDRGRRGIDAVAKHQRHQFGPLILPAGETLLNRRTLLHPLPLLLLRRPYHLHGWSWGWGLGEAEKAGARKRGNLGLGLGLWF